MMHVRKRLACCTRERQGSLDLDDQERVMTFKGLESCILNNEVYDAESRTSKGEGCVTDSIDEGYSSCSSSKDVFGSFSSKWMAVRKDEQDLDQWELSNSPPQIYVKEKPTCAIQFSDVEAMKERFAKLLLGEDVTGGHKGVTAALALSNAITNLAASVFGELWKLEPIPEERKIKWRREMDWLVSPTNYMVELVPAKQSGANGIFEIMTPKPRSDVHMNLPALQKLNSILIETLDSMVNTEFWYTEVGNKSEGRTRSTRESKRWWLPSPQVPKSGLSDTERKRLLSHSKLIHQVFKAAKSINESVLLEIPVPIAIKEALPKSGRASVGEELYKVLSTESSSVEDIFSLLNLKSEHSALEMVNRLEAAILPWKDRITEQSSAKSPIQTSWSFGKDSMSDLEKTELLLSRAEALLQNLKTRFPNLPQTFLDAKKVQYCKDVGHSIQEAYSRVLGNLAFSILSRIGDILKEDALSNPSSPAVACIPGMNMLKSSNASGGAYHKRTSLSDAMNKVEGRYCGYLSESTSDVDISCGEAKANAATVTATPSRGTVWCIGRDACATDSPRNSPCKRRVSFD